MKQAQLFAGFTTPTDVTTDGVVLLTNQRTGISAYRTLKLTEKQVTKGCMDFLQIRGWYAVRTPVGRMDREYGGEWLGEEGRSDWLFIHPYYNHFWVEMKATGKKPDPHQVAWMDQKGPFPEPPEPDPDPIDQGELEKLIARERELVESWAQKLKRLSRLEHALYHWYVTCGVPKNRVCRTIGLKTWEFEALAKTAGDKLDIPLKQIRDERRAAAAAA